MAMWKIFVAALLVFGSGGRTRGTKVCLEGEAKEFTCSNPVLTFNTTGRGIDLRLNVTDKRQHHSLSIRIQQIPEGLNISSLVIPDEGKVEFKIKAHFVQVMNSSSPVTVFENDEKEIGFFEFSAPSGVRICVTCDKEDIFARERSEQSSTSSHQKTEQENTFTNENREQENTSATDNGIQEKSFTTENREQENTLTTENKEQENTSATKNTEQQRKPGGIGTASSVEEEDEENRSWWWLLLIPACVILVVYLHNRHRQSSRYSVRNAQASEDAESKVDRTPEMEKTNGGDPCAEEKAENGRNLEC
ncbi:uncharacterized protein LOC125040164 [Penaeus chinensis]|uniref:uncharacterized protein LOC125040164 n=1 Tax=Penaeus chinensis TaxID=139456 RepID=UPI001FB65BCC|nr:uncharacterized protein LOC125040164 [Penaeus chinensis]